MTIQEMIDRARKAQDEIKDYTQEQVDKLVYAAAKAIYDQAEPLAKEAVEETGFGNFEDKIGKNIWTPACFWDYLKDKKSVGIINEDPSQGLIEVAHPIGVIAAITPATNPTVTPLGNFMHIVKGKNAMIVCPAPRAQQTSTDTVNLIREALKKEGAPEDLAQIVEDATIDKSRELMENSDLVLATGSSALTMAAYSSGTPAYGVGPGNPPAILDRDFDLKDAAEMSIEAVASDNGILCDGDNLLLYPQEKEAEFFAAFEEAGASIFTDKESIDKFRDVIFSEGKQIPDSIGKEAVDLAKDAGVEVPDGKKVIGLKLDVVGSADILCHEIMGPVVVLKSYDKFEDAVDMAIQNMVESGGIGHTAGIFSNDKAHIDYYSEKVPVARVLVNQPTPDAWGPTTNALSPAVSEGCGSWGNNILAGNVDYIHMINVSKVVNKLPVDMPDPKALFE